MLFKIAFWEEGGYGNHCTVVPVTCLPPIFQIQERFSQYATWKILGRGLTGPAKELRTPCELVITKASMFL